MELTPIRKGDIEVGKPLPWPVYDRKKNLLLAYGHIVESQHQLDLLMENGLYRNPAWKKTAPAERLGEKEDLSRLEIVRFTSIGIEPGEILQMQISDETEQRYGVRLIGFLEKKSVLVTPPVVNEEVILMRAGQGVMLRGFAGKHAYAFSSTVLRVCNMPYPYLHLSYPIEVRGMKIRKAVRTRSNVIGSVWREENPGRKFSCTIEDISFTGAQITSEENLGEADARIVLYFRVAGQGSAAYVTAPAVIRRIFETEGTKHRFGIEFMNLEQGDSFALQVLFYQNHFEIS